MEESISYAFNYLTYIFKKRNYEHFNENFWQP